MFNLPVSLKRTGTTVLGTVDATAQVITSTANSLARFAETAEAHSTEYRDAQIHRIQQTSQSRRLLGDHEAATALARRLRDLDRELVGDDDLKRFYDMVLAETKLKPLLASKPEETTAPELSVAAG